MRRREFFTGLAGAAVWPLATHAQQQKRMPVIGYLHFGSHDLAAPAGSAFLRGLSEAGYVERQNVAIEYRYAEGHYNRLPALVTDFVDHKVDVIVAIGPPSARAAQNATSTIPIVFTVGTDPVQDGLVTNLARPGGNLTGISNLAVELVPKRLELLSELVPQARVIALLANPSNGYSEPMIRDVQEAARVKGVQLPILKAATESQIDAAFATLFALNADALLVGDDPFFSSRRDQLVARASRYAVPTIYQFREFVWAGGLMSYGSSLAASYLQLGVYTGRLLRGERPADLPVQQATKVELVINLKTAKALGIAFPLTLLGRADEVIE